MNISANEEVFGLVEAAAAATRRRRRRRTEKIDRLTANQSHGMVAGDGQTPPPPQPPLFTRRHARATKQITKMPHDPCACACLLMALVIFQNVAGGVKCRHNIYMSRIMKMLATVPMATQRCHCVYDMCALEFE